MLLLDGPEEPLLGGDVTVGLVRIGDTVRRPLQPASALVEAVLDFLERTGFEGAPRFLGRDAQGRQALSFVSGEVAGRPWPGWMADNDRIASVARLVRRFDDAMQPFGVPADVRTNALADPPGTPPSIAGPPLFVGHMDITPENVVFVDGQASALIDFDMARPTDRVNIYPREVEEVLLLHRSGARWCPARWCSARRSALWAACAGLQRCAGTKQLVSHLLESIDTAKAVLRSRRRQPRATRSRGIALGWPDQRRGVR